MKRQQDNANGQAPVSDQLKQRVITGTVIGMVGLFVLCLSHIQWLFRIVIMLLSIGAGVELTNVNYFEGRWLFLLALSALATLVSAGDIPFYYPMILLVLIVVLCTFGTIIVFMERQQWPSEPNFPLQLILSITCILFFHAAVEVWDQENGFLYLLMAVICTSATDVFAYFVGRTFGRHKLAPRTSPSKTISRLLFQLQQQFTSPEIDTNGTTDIKSLNILFAIQSPELPQHSFFDFPTQ